MIFSVTQRCSINILLLLFFFIHNVASIQNNVETMLQRCIVLKIVVANRLVSHIWEVFLAQHRVATLFWMLTTLFQYCDAVLRKKSSLRIVPCNKTLRLVRISLLVLAIQRVLRFFSESVFYKSNRKLISCVCIAWYKHSRRWENSRRLCKPSTSSRVCITVSNSPNPSHVYIRPCKHGKRFLLLKYYYIIGCRHLHHHAGICIIYQK